MHDPSLERNGIAAHTLAARICKKEVHVSMSCIADGKAFHGLRAQFVSAYAVKTTATTAAATSVA